jgi:hypothetical protein
MQQKHYRGETLSKGLPQPVQVPQRARRSGNVTSTHDLSPISASVGAQNLSIESQQGNGDKMSNKAGETTTPTSQKPASVSTLDDRYGQIGISAVLAAVRYQGAAKNPAYAPAPTPWYDRTSDAAA